MPCHDPFRGMTREQEAQYIAAQAASTHRALATSQLRDILKILLDNQDTANISVNMLGWLAEDCKEKAHYYMYEKGNPESARIYKVIRDKIRADLKSKNISTDIDNLPTDGSPITMCCEIIRKCLDNDKPLYVGDTSRWDSKLTMDDKSNIWALQWFLSHCESDLRNAKADGDNKEIHIINGYIEKAKQRLQPLLDKQHDRCKN